MLLALGAFELGVALGIVLLNGAGEQVIGVAARAVIASVERVQVGRYRTFGNQQGDTIGSILAADA